MIMQHCKSFQIYIYIFSSSNVSETETEMDRVGTHVAMLKWISRCILLGTAAVISEGVGKA